MLLELPTEVELFTDKICILVIFAGIGFFIYAGKRWPSGVWSDDHEKALDTISDQQKELEEQEKMLADQDEEISKLKKKKKKKGN